MFVMENTTLLEYLPKLTLQMDNEPLFTELELNLTDHQLLMYRIGNGLKVYVQPIILIMGIICNCLSFQVMILPRCRRISCCVYLASLAVSDNIMLLSTSYYIYRTGLFPVKMGEVECMIIVYTYMSASCYGVMVILAVTTERFVAVCYPLKKLKWCTATRAKYIVSILAVLVLISNLPYLIYSKPVSRSRLCGPIAEKNNFTLVYSILNFCFSCVTPFTILLILNSCIINKVMPGKCCSSYDVQTISNIPSVSSIESWSQDKARSINSESLTRERQMTTTLLTVSFALLFLTAPQYIRHVVYRLTNMRSSDENYGSYILFNSFTNTPFYLNHAVNLWLYIISGSKFRQDLLNIYSCCRQNSNPKNIIRQKQST